MHFWQEYHRFDIVPFSMYDSRRHDVNMSTIIDDVNFDHLVKGCLLGFSIIKLLFFSLKLISISWRYTLRLCKYFCLLVLASIDDLKLLTCTPVKK